MKKILKGIVICILIILCISSWNIINSAENTIPKGKTIRYLIGKGYDYLINLNFGGFDFNTDDVDNTEWYMYDEDNGVICVHDWSYDKGYCGHDPYEYENEDGTIVEVNCNCQYELNKDVSGIYNYYDRIVFNPNGKQMTGLLYNNAAGKSAGGYDYGKDVTFLSRMFYEFRTDVETDNWALIQEYRLFCMNHMSQNFKNSLKNVSGSFRYFVHEEELSYNGNEYAGIGHYSQEGKEVYIKSDVYSKFINNLSNKYTIANKNHININNAKNAKIETLVDTNKKWTITVDAPYYKKNNYYDGVKYEYQFVNSSNNESTEFLSATAKLASGQSGNGYKKVEISGNANTITSADTLVIKCTYPTYTGLAMGFATGAGQERFLVSGKTNEYVSYIAYKLKKDPNVTVTKNVKYINTTDVLINKKSANVERGDTVLFEIQVNNTGSETKINLADTIPAGLTFVRYKDSITREWSTNWNGLSNVTISSNGKIIIYLVCKVNNDAKGTIKNIATVTPVRGNQLNKGNVAKLEDSASVTVLDYDYSLKKTVNKDNIEVGDIIEYTINLTNKNDTYLRDMIIEDEIPAGLNCISCTANSKWNISKAARKITFTRKSGELMGKGINTFTIKCKVSDDYLSQTKNTSITNTAKLTQVKNKHKIPLETRESSVKTNILHYDYAITKVVNAIYRADNVTNTNKTSIAEPGDIIEYKISIKNDGTGAMHNIKIEDKIPSGMIYDSHSDGWSKNGNKYTYNNVLKKGNTAELYIKVKVKEKAYNNIHNEINTAKISKVENKNGVDITKVKEESATVTILGYNASINKYITKRNNEKVEGRSVKSNSDKYNNPVVVKQGDTVTYTIILKNTGNKETTGETKLYNPQIVDILPPGLEYQSHSKGWTRDKDNNTYTYNGQVGIDKKIKLEITAKVTMSNTYLYNIKNEAKYGKVGNINGIDVSGALKLENNEDYIRLDELDIAGTVWEDTNKDGMMDLEEPRLEGIKVILHNETDKTTIEKTTDPNGYYKFDKETEVLKGTNRDANGNYQETSKHKEYYLEFKYDSINYKSTVYSAKNNLDAQNLNITEKYKIDSNATEIKAERKDLNEKLEIISYNKGQNASKTKQIDLEYEYGVSAEKGEVISTLKNKEQISSYSFINPDNAEVEALWLKGNSGELENTSTEYLEYINFGLINKEADLSLRTDLTRITQTINGQRLSIERLDRVNYTDKSEKGGYSGTIMATDVDYNHEIRYGAVEEVKEDKGKESEYNCETTFETTIENEGNTYTQVKEIIQYYDKKFAPVFNNDGSLYTKNMRIDRNDDGIFEESDFVYQFSVQYERVKEVRNVDTQLIEDITITEGTKDVIITQEGVYNSCIPNENAYQLDLMNKVYISGFEDVILAPGEKLRIYTTYLLSEDSINKIKNGEKLNNKIFSEINAYSTYEDKEGKNYAGSVDIDSNPGNLGHLLNSKNHIVWEDDSDHTTIALKKNSSVRRIEGTVWDDINLNGEFDKEEKTIEGVTVKLYEVVKIDDKYLDFEIKECETKTDSEGKYQIKNFIPGLYKIRFVYGNDENNLEYNGHDYKSTIYNHNDVENFEKNASGQSITNDNIIQIGPSLHQKYYNTSAHKSEINDEIRYSDARDDEKRRLEVMKYSLEMYNEKAEILKGNDSSNKEELIKNTHMYADTATFLAKIENIPPNEKGEDGVTDHTIHLGHIDGGINRNSYSFMYIVGKDKLKDAKKEVLKNGGEVFGGSYETGVWEEWESNNKTYRRNYIINNIDFGLQKRPENKLELQKYVKQIKLETSTGELLVDLYYDIYDSTGNLKVDDDNIIQPELNKAFSKGFENVQSLNNTLTQQGRRYINVDEDLLQGAKITIKYGFIATNNSENDYISKNLYGEEDEFESKTTKNILDDMKNAINSIDDNKKYLDSKNYYGYYLGNNYYKGTPGSNDVVAQLKIDNILDYVDNNLVFKPDEHEGKWGAIKKEELIIDKYLQEDVYITVDGIKLIADINGTEYQTDTKNNLAITIDDNTTNSDVSKFLLPGEKVETELTVSTILSPENKSDDMVYENIAEIIKFTTMTGRRTVKNGDGAHTVGNAKIHYAGYRTDKQTELIGGVRTYLDESDTAIVEKVMLTPPTGKDLFNIYEITEMVIYSINIITIIGVAIVIIPRIRRKIKNRY